MLSKSPIDPGTQFATAQLERSLCDPARVGKFDGLQPARLDAWSREFPRLDSLPRHTNPGKPLAICIATEDIAGPVRNGGIGTTFAALAEMLAALGHDTTILYLRGNEVEIGTIDEWIAHYAAKNIRFVPVWNYAVRDGLQSPANRWLAPQYNMLLYLLEHPFDVVHVSEWRGSAYLSLLVKRQGLAFSDTLFAVKTSSPWLWNRLYGSHTLDRVEDLAKIYAERQCVELADIVIGGSRHLLRWMASQGYKLPEGRTYVQPNVADFRHLSHLMGRRADLVGRRMPIDELVFFGRLETRKGLVTFCQAIKRLLRKKVRLPSKITFLGKPGARLGVEPHATVLDYIASETKTWPCEISVLTELQQEAALEYLLGGNRLAVMPSAIENSSMAVYEAAICGIPFVASNSGGTPELVDPCHHDAVLCDPHPIALGEKIAAAIALGGFVAGPSFRNDDNLGIWRGFHDNLARGLSTELARQEHHSVGELGSPSVTVCIYSTGELPALKDTIAALEAQTATPDEVIIAVDSDEVDAAARIGGVLSESRLKSRLLDASDEDAGFAFNRLAREARTHHLLLLWEGATLDARALVTLHRVARLSGADVLNFLFREIDPDEPGDAGLLTASIIGSPTDAFFRQDLVPQPLFVSREAFLSVGGFTNDYRVLGFDAEFVCEAQLAGLNCQTAITELGTVNKLNAAWLENRGYATAPSYVRAIRPQLAAAPLALRDLLLLAKGFSLRLGARREQPKKADANPRRRKRAANSLTRILEAAYNEDLRPRGPAASRSAKGTKPPPERAPAAQGVVKRPVHDLIQRLERSTTPEYSAGLLFCRDGAVHGWAYRDREVGDGVRIEALQNGAVIAIAETGREQNFIGKEFPDKVIANQFQLLLAPKPSRQLRNNRKFDLRIEGTDIYLAQGLEIFEPRFDIEAAGYDGYCDPSDQGWIQGWAWKPGASSETVDVAILIDGKFVTRVGADRYREDLLDQNIGSGAYGFRELLPKAFRDGSGHVIEILVADGGLALKPGPMMAQGKQIEHAGTSGTRGRWNKYGRRIRAWWRR